MTRVSNSSLSLALVTLLIALQFQLWCGQGGLQDIWRLKNAIIAAELTTNKMAEQNAILTADVADLRAGDEAVAEHARNDLGMIAKQERFYQIVED